MCHTKCVCWKQPPGQQARTVKLPKCWSPGSLLSWADFRTRFFSQGWLPYKQPDRQLFSLSSHQAWSLSDNLHHVCMPLPFHLELFTLRNWRQSILIHSKLTRSELRWWLTPVISSLERLMCDNPPVFRASLGYRVSSDKPGRGLPQKTKQWQQEIQVTTEFIYLICVYMNRYVCGTHVPTCVMCQGTVWRSCRYFWPLWLPINTEFWKWKKPVAKGHVLCD